MTFIPTKENRRLAEAWAYLNDGIERGLWNHEDFAGLDDKEIIQLAERIQGYERTFKN